jgi:microcystin-dependent protein
MPYVGEIRAFTSELPQDWLPCDGRLLPFNKYPALGAAISTSYGGDDRAQMFALPDLRGRVVAGADPGQKQPNGVTSGAVDMGSTLLPYTVIRWGISVSGVFPFKD